VRGSPRLAAHPLRGWCFRTIPKRVALRIPAFAPHVRGGGATMSMSDEFAPLAASAPRVLVVDPDEEARRHLVELGRDHYVRVVAVEGAAQAIAAVRRGERFHAAFVDTALSPRGTSFALARELRALPGNARLSVAFTTESSSIAERV